MDLEEWDEWDRNYDGGQMRVTKDELIEYMEYDAEELTNANHHTESEAMWRLVALVRTWDETNQPIGLFAYHVSDLGPVRHFYVS